jgi:hypothetical protein
MKNDIEKLIDQYLDRVRVYLPLGEEDTLTEIRTHLLDEAERIGQGTVTAGSTMMAIERLGDPKRIANEYAGTGEKVGPVPAEYVQPTIRIIIALFGIASAFGIGTMIVGIAFPTIIGEIGTLSNFPLFIGGTVVVNIIFAFMIVGVISLVTDKQKLPTERTTLESILGIGSEAFKPKPRTDAAGEFIFGVIFALILLTPQIRIMFNPSVLPFLTTGSILLAFDAVKGLSFYNYGENNLNLIFEASISIGWVILSLFLINFPWPLDYYYVFSGGTWQLVPMTELTSILPEILTFFPFGFIWLVIIFVIVVSNTWHVIASTTKISMYLNDGKGWWWKGSWGQRKRGKKINYQSKEQL